MSPVATTQRFTRAKPCPICGGWDQQARGHAARCFGYLDESGKFARCTRPEHAGSLDRNSDQTFSHVLTGECRCGAVHGEDSVGRRVAAEYTYRLENGELAYQVVRFSPKAFSQRRPVGAGGWAWGLNGTRRVLYRLPELLSADPGRWVSIVEGEKDVDRLIGLGMVATTAPGGAGKWRDDYSESLRGRRVCVIPDADEVGRSHAADVAARLSGIASEIRVLELPGLPEHGDVADWLDAGHSAEELKECIRSSQPWRPSSATDRAARSGGGLLHIVMASEIESRPIDFIWQGRIARGKLTLVGGDPGVGKGTFGIDLAMRVSTGAPWPDGGQAPLGRALLLTPEDDPRDTIKPRLEVAGADYSRVGILSKIEDGNGTVRRVSLDLDADLLIEKAAAANYDVVVIDPLSSYLGSGTDSHRDPDVRRILDPLAEAAARHHVAVVLVAHLNKSESAKSMYRFLGSIAMVAACRFTFLVARHPDDADLSVMATVKSNLARRAPSLTFRVVGKPHPVADKHGIGCVVWSGMSPLSADELAAGGGGHGGQALERAKEFLTEHLAGGPAFSDDIKAAAKDRGIGSNSLWEAKSALKVAAVKDGLGRWSWRLPDPSAEPPATSAEGRDWTLR